MATAFLILQQATHISISMGTAVTPPGDVDFTGNLFNPVTGPYYIQNIGGAEVLAPDTPVSFAAG